MDRPRQRRIPRRLCCRGEGQSQRRGLTGQRLPLYSAGFAAPALLAGVVKCPCGGTGRRARLKIEFRKECWFDSGQGHQPTLLRSFGWRGHPRIIVAKRRRLPREALAKPGGACRFPIAIVKQPSPFIKRHCERAILLRPSFRGDAGAWKSRDFARCTRAPE